MRPRLHFLAFQAGTASVAITALFVWPFLGRHLSTSEVGQLAGWLAISSIVSPALALALHLTLANRLSSAPERAFQIEGRLSAVWSGALIALAVILIAFGLAGPLLLSVGALCAANASSLIVTGTARGLNRPWIFASYTFVTQIGGLLALGVGVALGSFSHGVLAYVIASATGLLAEVLLLRGLPAQMDWAGAAYVLRQSLRLVPHLILAVVLLMMMRLIVGAEDGVSSLGEFQYASLLIGGMTTLAASLDAHWSVRAQVEKERVSLVHRLRSQQLKLQVVLFVVLLFLVGFCLVGLPFWLPAGYPSADIRLAVFLALPSGALQAFADGKAAFVMWHDRYGTVSVSTIASVVVALAMGAIIVKLIGWPFVGLAVTTGALVRALILTNISARVDFTSGFGRGVKIIICCSFLVAAVACGTTLLEVN